MFANVFLLINVLSQQLIIKPTRKQSTAGSDTCGIPTFHIRQPEFQIQLWFLGSLSSFFFFLSLFNFFFLFKAFNFQMIFTQLINIGRIKGQGKVDVLIASKFSFLFPVSGGRPGEKALPPSQLSQHMGMGTSSPTSTQGLDVVYTPRVLSR